MSDKPTSSTSKPLIRGARALWWSTIFLVMTVALLLWFGLDVVLTQQGVNERRAQDLEMEELRADILLLDEALTMSALLAAASGEPAWPERHARLSDQLDVVLAKTQAIAPMRSLGSAARATERANNALIGMERRALALARNLQLKEAQELLAGDAYHHQKEIYAQQAHRLAAISEPYLRVERLRGSIRLLDEALAMSALAAVSTGRASWAVRYEALRPWFEEALLEAQKLLESAGEPGRVGKDDGSRARRTAIEREALGLVRDGRVDQARLILSNESYTAYKQRSRVRLDELTAALQRQARSVLLEQQRGAWLKALTACVIVALLVAAWFVASWNVHASQHTLRQTNSALEDKTRRLSHFMERQEKVEIALRDTQDELLRAQEKLIRSARLANRNRLLQRAEQAMESSRDAPLARIATSGAVEEALRLVSRSLDMRRIRFRAALDPDVAVWTDPLELQQLTMNLIVHAIDVMPNGGELSVLLEAGDDETVVLSFSNSGPGLSPEQVERVFDSSSLDTPGAAHGSAELVVTRVLVEKAGGAIRAEPSTAGQTYRIELPRRTTGEPASRPDLGATTGTSAV